MLSDVAGLLACPECRCALDHGEHALVCLRGHSFDIARQGYVSLSTGAGANVTGDTADMLAARERFQRTGLFRPIADAVAAAVADADAVVDIGAGTGYYLARMLDDVPDAYGIGIDASKAAARRLARVHPRAGSVVADAWRGLPIRDRVLTHASSIFAPRNPEHVHRVLAEDGRYVVVTPTDRHLRELVAPLDLVRVEGDKVRRLAAALSRRFEPVARNRLEYPMTLCRNDVDAVIAMGPSARHRGAARRQRIAALPDETAVTASVFVSVYRRLADDG